MEAETEYQQEHQQNCTKKQLNVTDILQKLMLYFLMARARLSVKRNHMCGQYTAGTCLSFL